MAYLWQWQQEDDNIKAKVGDCECLINHQRVAVGTQHSQFVVRAPEKVKSRVAHEEECEEEGDDPRDSQNNEDVDGPVEHDASMYSEDSAVEGQYTDLDAAQCKRLKP